MEALIAASGSLLVVCGYMLIKKISRSRCAVDSGCVECESPAVELQKKQTERLDDLYEIIKKLEDQVPRALHSEEGLVETPAATIGEPTTDDNPVACLTCPPPSRVENHVCE